MDEKFIRDLVTLRLLDDASNVLSMGQPGVGKTMLATALARGTAEAGNRVHFITAADLATRCHKAAADGRWATGANASSGPMVSMTRCAAECDAPNSGPICRIVTFVRQ